MTHQPPLFEIPERAAARPHLFSGWRQVLANLDGTGRRWLVSAWVTEANPELLALVRPGDRLILRGDAGDFLRGMSDLQAVRAFMERGVEVRRLPNLHAKLYAAEDGHSGVVWLGSANLTRPGAHGDGWRHAGVEANVEAMAGPLPLDAALLSALEDLWYRARPFDPRLIEQEVATLATDREGLLSALDGALTVLAVQLSFRLLGGSCTIQPSWLGHTGQQAQRDQVSYPSVGYLDPQSGLGRQLRQFQAQWRRGLRHDLLEKVAEADGLYVLQAAHRFEVERRLAELETQVRERFGAALAQGHQALRENFERRFERAFEGFLQEKNRPLAHPTGQVVQQALLAFDEYLARDPFRVSAQFFVPLASLDEPESALMQAVRRIEQRQRLL